VTDTDSKQPARRRASRAAGPAAGESVVDTAVRVDALPKAVKPLALSAGPPPRRPANRRVVGLLALAGGVLGTVALAIGLVFLITGQRQVDAAQQRNQRFVDTATQTVVNMFTFTPDTIDDSVNRFVGGTSGPLRDMLSQNNNVDNLKGMFRDTHASSEAVINGAALEAIDTVSDNASVLVSARVTVTDIDGVNKPTQPYRMRVVVHEDDNGRMTGYDLKYPNGGN
jgi:hypothetical protein